MTTVTVLCRHYYKSCGKSHGKKRLNRKALMRPRKTYTEVADVTCWGRLFQVRTAATGKAGSPCTKSQILLLLPVLTRRPVISVMNNKT